MKATNPNPKPKPKPKAVALRTHAQPSSKASSSSSSAAAAAAAAAADSTPNTHRNPLTIAASTPPNPNPNPNPVAAVAAAPLPPLRPLLTVAAVEAAMASIPPPPPYGLESLDRRTITLSDGTVRSYFVLPQEPPPHLLPPPFPAARHLGPPADWWTPSAAAAPPGPPPPKRKWEEHANGTAQGESSGRQQQEERRVAKQAKAETVEVDAKVLKAAFLKMVKVINESAEQKKNYRANGTHSPLKCVVCGRESVDLHSLLNHAYNAKNADLRADHLGLHKALCVLMGWNYSVDPVNKKAYQTLSTAEAEANQGDLILWPPTVMLENTYRLRKDGQRDSIANKEMESKLREMGYPGAKVKPVYGKDGHRGVVQVKFASSLAGLNEAVRLAEFFEKEGRGREGWACAQNTPAAADGSNPMLIKVDDNGEPTWVLYGYLAMAWDLDMLDIESKKRAIIKSRTAPDLSD